MIPPRHIKQEEGVDSWLMSYADMITLLLSFFIVFVSVSEPKNDKFSQVTRGISSKFGGSVDLSTPFQGMVQILQATVENNKAFKDASIEKSDKSVMMELSAEAFYKPDSAELDQSKLQLLSELTDSFKKIDYLDYNVIIEAYTNDAPAAVFPSNWELSSARASRLVRFFIEHGVAADRLRAVGYGETHPKVPNRDSNDKPIKENQAANQRVLIKIERIL